MGISLTYSLYTTRRSCFVKHFLKMVLALAENPLNSTTTAIARAATTKAMPSAPVHHHSLRAGPNMFQQYHYVWPAASGRHAPDTHRTCSWLPSSLATGLGCASFCLSHGSLPLPGVFRS
jgi:hypothetical protein